LKKYLQNMSMKWNRSKIRDIRVHFNDPSFYQLLEKSILGIIWFFFKRTIGRLIYGNPFVIVFLILFLRDPSLWQFFIFFLGGLGITSLLHGMANDMVNYRQSQALHKYLNELEQSNVTLQPYEIEDYIKDEESLEQLRLDRPNHFRSNQKLGRVMLMKMPSGVVMSKAKAFVISGSHNLHGLVDKIRILSLIFIHDEPDRLTTFGKFKFFHELSHLTTRSFFIREREYLYRLIPFIFLGLFLCVFSLEKLYLILFFIPYFLILNLHNNKADRAFFDEVYCDLYAIDSFSDIDEINKLKELLPMTFTQRFESDEILKKGVAYRLFGEHVVPGYIQSLEDKANGRSLWGILESQTIYFNEDLKTLSSFLFVGASFYITMPSVNFVNLFILLAAIAFYTFYAKSAQISTTNRLSKRIEKLIQKNTVSVE